MEMRTILNFKFSTLPGGAAIAEDSRPARALFRLGEAPRGQGAWGRAVLLAAAVHGVALLAALFATRAPEKAPARPEEPELVFLAFRPAPAAAPGAASSVSEAPQRMASRHARTRPARLSVPPVVPTPLPAQPPAPVEEPAPEKPSEAAAEAVANVDAEASTGTGGAAGVGNVVGGLVGGVLDGQQGSGLGSTGGEALSVKQVARAPEVLQRVLPSYPRQARARGIEGLVLVRLIIGTDGRVEPENARVLQSVPALDAAALAAVRQWRFSPAIGLHGRPVRVVIDVPVQFSLK